MKSAYFLARDFLGLPCPDRNSRRKSWAVLWQSEAGPRVINFARKVLHGIVPTSVALLTKGVDYDSMCRVCGIHHESQIHVLISCSLAQSFWSSVCPSLLVYMNGQGENLD